MTNQVRKKVAVGLSGGVDSAVAALLLKKEGYDVTGVYFKCWEADGECGECGKNSAEEVAEHLDIKFVDLDFGDKFKKEIIDYFINEYASGRTPNPDVVCNEKVKFGAFYDWAIKNGFDFIATGHYARVKNGKLLRGKDRSKDQSYFLYRIPSEKLTKILLPLGNFTKNKVRIIAKNNDISAVNRPESVDICFVGKSTLKNYLSKKIKLKKGNVLDGNGNVVGEHDGVWFFTIGQRKGFRVSKYFGKPMYVIGKNVERNELIIGEEGKTYKKEFEVSDIRWTLGEPKDKFSCKVRIRNLGKLYPAKFLNGKVISSKKIFGVADGQSAVFYNGDIVIGGGIIQ
ncbi:tRNA 2-thiouridine(34) synthase MnmA [Patescibacteria group bacterium]